jgi:group I intron endonuclease
LLYDNYVKKPVDEMVKRVLKGESPCGIYKITRLKTGEIYIGKSTDIKSRWQQHSKSAYHCGTISHSTLHTIMEKDGIENFTWEVLEEVPKDKLGEREKYWIQYYDSKNFGLNEKAGG